MGIKKTKPGSGLVLRGRTMQNLSRFRGVGLAAAIGIILTFASISTASAQVWLDPNSCWGYQRLNSRTHEWEWQRSDIETGASIAKWAQQTWLKGNNIIQWKENKRYVRVPCSPRESELGLAALAIFGEVEVGGSSTTTAPQLFAPFSVASSGFVGGGSLGAYVPLPVLLPGLSVGVRGTVLGFGGNSGSAVFPPTGERFNFGINSMETVDAIILSHIHLGPGGGSRRVVVDAFVGGAWAQTTNSSPVESVDKTLDGHSFGVGVQVPIEIVVPGALPNMPGTLIGLQWRHYNVSGDVQLFPSSAPTHVDQKGNIFTAILTVPINDVSDFFNTGSLSHELKYGAGYRRAGSQ